MGRPTDPNFWQQSPPPSTADMNAERTLNQRFVREMPGALPPQDVSIQDGVISGFESASLIVDTEGGGSADELEVINPVITATENLHHGMIIGLRAKDPARVVTVKNSDAANGINTSDGKDVELSPDWELTLRLVGGRWYEVRGRANAEATTALNRTAPTTADSLGIMQVGNGLSVSNGVVSVVPQYGACHTAGDNPNKVVDIPGFVLHPRAAIVVGFVYINTAPNPTLNVSGTGAFPIKWPGKNMEISPNISYFRLQLAFDGNDWFIVGEPEEPVGTVKMGFYSSLPLYLPMNGTAVSRTTYAALFSLLGTRFGVGDGSTTFNLPDTRNKVLQGNSLYNLLFESREAGLQNITGRIGKSWTNQWTLPTNGNYAGAIRNGAMASTTMPDGSGKGTATIPIYDDFNASWSNSTYGKSSTVQMDAVTVNAFIKY